MVSGGTEADVCEWPLVGISQNFIDGSKVMAEKSEPRRRFSPFTMILTCGFVLVCVCA